MSASGWVWYRDEGDEAHVREDNARFRAVLGHCPRCIAVLDEEGNLVGYNQEFRSLLLGTPTIGDPIAHLFAEGPREMLAQVVATAGTQQRSGAIISMHTTKGEERDVEFLVATLPGDGARSIGVVMAADDRTEPIHDERDRSVLARDISDANCDRAMTLAQAAVCHDINNVLTVIGLAAATLRQPSVTPADAEALLREIEDGVKHGAAIVARTKEWPIAATPRETSDVRECVQRALRVVGPLARSARITLAIGSVDDATVPVAKTALTQVLTNLVANSVHAIEDAQRPGRIEVSATRTASDVIRLSVRDDGVGIEPSHLVDSFEAFQTTRGARGGTGLGLAIVRQIVEGAGGRIDVVSTPGSGTEMHLELPTEVRGAQAVSSVA